MMKKFLQQVLLFWAIICIVHIIPCIVFENKAKSSTDKVPYAKINEVIKMADVDADLVVLGNSRAEGGYDTALMNGMSGLKCLNLGNSGYSFDYSYHIMYENYIKHNKKPKYIIVEVGPWCFFDQIGPIYTIQMLPYINRPEFKFYIDLCPQLSMVDKMLLFRYVGKQRKVMEEIVYLRRPLDQKKETKTSWCKDYFGKPQRLEHRKSTIELFASFLNESKAQGIDVILVCSPLHVDDGLRYFNMDGFWNIVRYCNMGKGFPMVTYQDYFGNDTTLFSDPAHLNDAGKRLFTAKLMHDLDSVGIIPSHH